MGNVEDHQQNSAVCKDIQQLVKDNLAAFELSTLKVLALTVGLIFTARIIATFAQNSMDQAWTIVIPMVLGLTVSCSIIIAHKYKKLAHFTIRPLTVLLATLVSFNVFYILHVAGNQTQNQLFFSALVLAAFGLAAATVSMWLMFVIPFIILYLTSLFILDVGNLLPYIAMLVGGFAISTVAFFIRVPTIRKLIELEVIHADNAKKLALSNKAKDRFLANMTHELRTPMTGVMGMIDLMADTKLTSEQQQYLQTADKSARYLMTVINDILDMAKLDAGKLVINQKPLDVIALTKNIASLFEVRVAQKGLSLVLKLPQVHTLPLNGDSVRISQILLNLMENALKFTDHGKITITLEVTINTQNTKLKWRVSDTGTGIAEDQLTKLFNRFEQADSSITRTTQGTGLGLAIIRDLVHLMDGKVGANSELGQGSEFWFELSLPSAVAEDINEEALPEKLKINSLHDHNQKRSTNETKTCIRILYAEDNPINRELIGRLIEREGWAGTSVNNGQEAVDAVNAGSDIFDLILMDIQMPIMDGLTALKIIKEETNGKLPIVALTANTLPKDVSLYEEAGFDAVVGKPINVTELRSEVEKLITTYK